MWSISSNIQWKTQTQPAAKEGVTTRKPLQNITNRNNTYTPPEKMYLAVKPQERPAVRFNFKQDDNPIEEDIPFMMDQDQIINNDDIDDIVW
ncbi:hypothetical protein TVAG_149030 [Trichomonas vaginalis G3]|uniref:Uncharacterized protein n=1 Tax=Trichomonas vaginalis (strain ATCC PRA-98 / G3) TaxID=412133 RepID=A2FEP8_TRIV3|nr:hypothetical protein TVAGG3_0375320 [Trichomonas vaginalis G3]EAX96628.1 hypothetical protein TVAG_149030 [Trichomonas vaginalis G3]KAI5532899.1 hypothetical protein TVAGG3_0375320 [Trichomonas vaginalis G3]|eukprot:XP_001309558.1 hypothetical protein [Trichomonas vaginalis G3]